MQLWSSFLPIAIYHLTWKQQTEKKKLIANHIFYVQEIRSAYFI